jgi:hypothetical protein
MCSEIHLTPQQMMNDIRERPTVPVWPHAGWAHGFKSKGGAYAAARRGEIATIKLGRRTPAITAPLRKRLQIEAE